MNENQELLKAAGFSDEFILYIQDFGSRVPQFFVASVDAAPIDYKSFDTTELVINNQNSSSATVFISSMGSDESENVRG